MPQDATSPTPGTAEVIPASKSYDEQVADISNLLDDPSPDLEEKDQDQAKAEEPIVEDDPLALGDAEVVENNDSQEPDGSEEPTYKGGQFVPDTGKVTLDDGTTITVAELKRNNLFQRDYTKKTTELSAEKEQIETARSEVDQYAQSLSQYRDYVTWYAEQHLPKQPEPFAGDAGTDPHGFIQWQQKQRAWETHVQAYHNFQQQKEAEEQRKSGETQAQTRARIAREADALKTAIPALKDPAKGKALWETLTTGLVKHYGFTDQEAQSISDHRQVLIVRDALAYRQLKAKAPQVREEVTRKPVTPGARRQDPRAQVNRDRQVRSERLRQDGSMESAIAALQDLDL